MSYVAYIDASACAAHGDCEVIAPEAFRVEDVAVVVNSAPDELMIEAARACPSAAIRLIDGGSGAQVYP
ncbi:MAG TPA: ferredoxin [Solirubrobacteraceae bacterium]|nr:ferredoxin [Solirubrobacteraceae bacterium]